MSSKKPTVRLNFCDFPGPTNIDAIKRVINKTHTIIVDDKNPDFVIYSVFGNSYLNNTEAIRIFFTGENVQPDFNLCDYAFGFSWMSLDDRYFRCPNYLLYEEFEVLRDSAERGETCRQTVPSESKEFCNFIYSNAEAHPFREELFKALSSYKRVHSAGPHLNNTGFLVGSPSLGLKKALDKIEYQTGFKFSIAAENSSSNGYTTEKLIHALASGTIPIYWGDPTVGRQFNTKRIVNCHEFSSIDQVVKRVIEIDQDEELYQSILMEPIFPGGITPVGLREGEISTALSNIFQRSREDCRRRNTHVWGRIYEERRRDEVFNNQRLSSPANRTKQLVKRVWEKFVS